MPFREEALLSYLEGLFGAPVEIRSIRPLAADKKGASLKRFGYGMPLGVAFSHPAGEETAVLHTMAPDAFSHERPSDRACNLLLDYATFNRLPRHVDALDVGALTGDGSLISLGETNEFFLLTRFSPGDPYADDLHRMARTFEASDLDRARVETLADYLAGIHEDKSDDAVRYHRRIRDLLGHGEGIMGMLDTYPADFAQAPPERLARIEEACVRWRWRIKESSHRLSCVHGDFHPWNVLFREGTDFSVLDRSRGEWGEPADDVTCMSINFLFFSLWKRGRLEDPFRDLYLRFWKRYLDRTGDKEILERNQPFHAWRALVLAHPVWYPDLPEGVRETLFRFIDNVLDAERFEPDGIEEFLA